MNKIILEVLEEPSLENPKMKPDKIFKQTFTCCGKTLEKVLWEGWDWISGNIIDKDLTWNFKYCPYCGKELEAEYEANT